MNKDRLSPQSNFRLSPKSIDFVGEIKNILESKKDIQINISGGDIFITIGKESKKLEKIEEILPYIKSQNK